MSIVYLYFLILKQKLNFSKKKTNAKNKINQKFYFQMKFLHHMIKVEQDRLMKVHNDNQIMIEFDFVQKQNFSINLEYLIKYFQYHYQAK